MTAWWRRVGPYAVPLWPRLLALTALVGVGVGLNLLKPWPVKLVVDYVLVDRDMPESLRRVTDQLDGRFALLLAMAGAVVGLFVVQRLNGMLKAYVQADVSSRLDHQLGEAVLDRLQRRSPAYLAGHRTGDLVKRVTGDATCLRDLVLSVLLPVFTSVATLASIFLIVWSIDPLMSMVAVSAAVPIALSIYFCAGPMSRRSFEHQQALGEQLAQTEQTLTSVPVVQAFRREALEHRRFRGLASSVVSTSMRALAAQLWFKGAVSVSTALGAAAITLIGGFRALHGHLTVGDLYLFLSYLAALYGPLETMAYLSSGFAAASGKGRRVVEVLDTADPIRDPESPSAAPAAGGRVVLEGVTAGYEPGRPVLRGIDLTAEPGEMVALVGPSGVGKSTLMSLVPRFLDPWEGRVLIDGVDARQLRLQDLRRRIAWLTQEPLLMPMTVAENIAFGRPEASREEIVAAAQAANAMGFIRAMPEGLDTPVGERGATLSGGQAQRLAIARALLVGASIVLLDEPTSALDPQTEAYVMDAIERLTARATTFVVAHRLSTVRRADRILVLRDGRIHEQGSHDQLMTLDGVYASITRRSAGGTLDSDEEPSAEG